MATLPPPHRIRCRVDRVKDGDTCLVRVNWANASNFDLATPVVTRLLDTDAMEINTLEGKEAKAEVEQLLEGHGSILEIEPKGFDKYGRTLVWCWIGDIPVGPYLAARGLTK